MKFDRRTAIKGSAMLGAGTAIPVAAAHAGMDQPLAVHDSRLPEARAFLEGRKGQATLDIAREEGGLWQASRRAAQQPRAVEGLTRWSDYVQLRELFEEQGLRVVAERKFAAPLTGRGELFRWTMQSR